MLNYILGKIHNIINPGVSLFAIVDNHSKVHKKAKIYWGAKIVKSVIGKYSYVGRGCVIINSKIGKFCSIAQNVSIGLAGHTLQFISTSPIFTEVKNATGKTWTKNSSLAYKNKQVEIGSDVWIGEGVKIINGIKVGCGAIIGSGAVVTKDVPPYAIVGGIPARIIRYRFDDETIKFLMRIRWWDKPEINLQKNIHLFQTANIQEFKKHYETMCEC